MKIAVLTDLHANREAVEACLEHAAARGAEQYAFLGDLVGYGCDPDWVMDTVMSHCQNGTGFAVLGNHDEAVIHGSRPTMREEARSVVDWTRARLSAEHLAFIEALPFTVAYKNTDTDTDLGETLFVHANAAAPREWGYIQRPSDVERSFNASRAERIFCGHVHNPMLYHDSPNGRVSEFKPNSGNPVTLVPHRRWLCIPGSVGQPRDGIPDACYALFDTVTLALCTWRVAYDVDATAAKIRAAGMPQNLAHRLTVGL